MSKTLSISAIKNGTVIDHIPAGQAFRIIRLLNLDKLKNPIMLGLNLSSKSMGAKDIIKIENKILNKVEANQISVFASKATINVVQDFEVHKKIAVQLPETISGVLICPNPKCVTQTEPVQSFFYVEEVGKHIKLNCKYCEKQFERDYVKEISA